MLGRLIKKELLEHLMSLRFAIALVLCLVVILCSLFVRVRDYNQVVDDYTQSVAMERQRLANIERPWGFPWSGVNVHLAPNPLKVFVRGLEDANGLAARVSTGPLQPEVKEAQNVSVALFPPIDLVAFVGLIMSLMAVVFGFDGICGEKDRGTLRLMLSYSVPRHTVLLGKWIGGYVTLVLPLLVTMIVAAVIVMLQPNISLSDGQWLRLVGIVVIGLLYLAAMYSLSLAVSCFTARASTAAMILLSVWVVLVLAVPNMSPYVAQALCPAANAQEIASAQRTAEADVREREYLSKRREYDRANGFADEWWENINWNDWESAKRVWQRWAQMVLYQKEASLTVLAERRKIEQKYRVNLDNQIAMSRWIARLSPFSCFAMASTELADAGLLERRRLMQQLEGYQETLCTYAFDECYAAEMTGLANQGNLPTPWARHRVNPVPAFTYAPAAGQDYARAIGMDAGLLAALAVGLFLVSYFKFLRYDVR